MNGLVEVGSTEVMHQVDLPDEWGLTVKINLVWILDETKVTGLSAIGEPIPWLSGNCTLVPPLVSAHHLKGRFDQQRREARLSKH